MHLKNTIKQVVLLVSKIDVLAVYLVITVTKQSNSLSVKFRPRLSPTPKSIKISWHALMR